MSRVVFYKFSSILDVTMGSLAKLVCLCEYFFIILICEYIFLFPLLYQRSFCLVPNNYYNYSLRCYKKILQ